ncbi:MAG: hypothetical protein Ct9H300mP4_13660 [Gammaproteobacteria bacterium]|nr:MAG: hypothetical protein Ct9H300mP4_13660 [Gammaproteobacteria bacterium]
MWLQDQENDASQMDATALSEQGIEEELARIQAAFEEEEVLEEFIPFRTAFRRHSSQFSIGYLNTNRELI